MRPSLLANDLTDATSRHGAHGPQGIPKNRGYSDANPRLYVGAPPHEVWVCNPLTGDRQPLDLRLDLRDHSPTGFCWGFGGSGPAQLALAILAHAGDTELALCLYQDFKWEFIAKLPQAQPWTLDRLTIKAWLEAQANVSVQDRPIGREVHSA